MRASNLKSMVTALLLVFSMVATNSAVATDDPSITGDLRKNVQQSMVDYIDRQTIKGHMFVYDAVKGNLLKLKLDQLHSGIVKKGEFYVSCADFVDQHGRKVDIDFMVRKADNKLITTQALVHSIDGRKRKYHLEEL